MQRMTACLLAGSGQARSGLTDLASANLLQTASIRPARYTGQRQDVESMHVFWNAMSSQTTHICHLGLSKNVLHDELESERRDYNERISCLRDLEYPMLEGTEQSVTVFTASFSQC